MKRALLGLVAAAWLAAGPPPAAHAADAGGGTLVVGTSGDYAPFSFTPDGEPGGLDGFDLALARAYARDAGVALDTVRFRWPGLARGLAERRFDVALSGVTVRPERSVYGRFGVAVAESGAVVLARAGAARRLDDLDREGVRVAVNAGGHLERVARARFRAARVEAVRPNDAVPRALAAGEVDAVVTDTLEAPHWEHDLPGVVRLGPFTRDRKAPLWVPEAGERAFALDAWLLAREADGTLARLRQRWLGVPGPRTATPLAALVAAVRERLAVMPLVARAKQATRRPVRDAEREARVLEAAQAGAARRAREAGVPALDPARVRVFYRAQIEAAVAVQERVLAARDTAPDGEGFDLQLQLRPALLRLGERIAWLLVRQDAVPERLALRRILRAELAGLGLGAAHADPIADAIVDLAQARVKTRARSPDGTASSSAAP